MADTPPRSDAELLDLAYPCALDAVAEIERRHIEERLATADPAVRKAFSDTVWHLRDVMARVAALDATAPPPELEERILAALPDDGRVVRLSARKRRARWLVAAAAAVCLVIGGSVVADRVADSPSVDQPAAQTLTTPVTGGGTVVVEISPNQRLALMAFDGVAQPPPDHVYQVWLVPDGQQPRSVGVLAELPSAGRPFVTAFATGEKLAVSVEPTGGSPAPTTDPIAGVLLP
ncbi:anti-sigma factor [Nocardia altamirensis]|uniref:anti-sigma factor n=1 Tax=Nocardia altamirensis TaxID=472158 RepID=UPI000840110F|nr:anti-sigma factor [Nocardia altamirensis]